MNALPQVQTLKEEFGTDPVSFYSADTFNEMRPPTDDPTYLSNVTSAIYQVRPTFLTAASGLCSLDSNFA